MAKNELKSMPQEELEASAWHELDLKQVVEMCDPMGVWMELKKPIKRAEVEACLARGEEALAVTPLWTSQIYGKAEERISMETARTRHIQKIAYFVKHPATTPIDLDVGIPSLGYASNHLIEDGHHRAAGAMIRGDATIRAKISGSIDYAQELGLWNPNACEQELHRRFEADLKKRSKPKL